MQVEMVEGLSENFIVGLRQLDLALSDQQVEQFMRYQQELLDWNARFNLTAITDSESEVCHPLAPMGLQGNLTSRIQGWGA
jgi:hypothetical protein